LASCLNWMGTCSLETGDPRIAREYFRQGLEVISGLIEDAPSTAKFRNNRVSAYEYMAKASDALDQPEQAIAERTSLLELKPAAAEALNLRGKNYASIKDWDKAIADQTRAIELKDKNASFYFDRAQAYRGADRIQESVTDLRLAIELDPKNAAYQKALADTEEPKN
jgi:tetratricopeptide (TPR) repeat protein